MSGAHIVENTNNEKIEKPNISNLTASTHNPPPTPHHTNTPLNNITNY